MRIVESLEQMKADLYSHLTASMQDDAAAEIDAAFRRAKIGSEGAGRGGKAATWAATDVSS